MATRSHRVVVGVTAVLGAIVAGEVAGMNTRSFISWSGSDLNLCNLSSQCKTLQRALDQTSASGEVIVDGSYDIGAAVVTRSVQIRAVANTFPKLLVAPMSSGIVIDGVDIDVSIKGLHLQGDLGRSANGIEVVRAGSVAVYGGSSSLLNIVFNVGAQTKRTRIVGHSVEWSNVGYRAEGPADGLYASFDDCRFAGLRDAAISVDGDADVQVRDTTVTAVANASQTARALRATADGAGKLNRWTIEASYLHRNQVAFEAAGTNGAVAQMYVRRSRVVNNDNAFLAIFGMLFSPVDNLFELTGNETGSISPLPSW
jgi:hypothetical protein